MELDESDTRKNRVPVVPAAAAAYWQTPQAGRQARQAGVLNEKVTK